MATRMTLRLWDDDLLPEIARLSTDPDSPYYRRSQNSIVNMILQEKLSWLRRRSKGKRANNGRRR